MQTNSSSSAVLRSSMSGFLQQKQIFGKWKSYFFVLHDGTLSKFKSEKATSPSEEIEFTSTTEVVYGDGISGRRYTIAVLIQNRSPLLLSAKDEKEYNSWYNALTSVVNSFSETQQSQGQSSRSRKSLKNVVIRSNSFTETSSASNSSTATNNTIAVLEAVVEPCVISDQKGNIVGFNKAAEQLFGYQKSEAVGENVKKLMPSSFARYHDQYLRTYFETGHKKLIGIPRKLFVVRKDSSQVPVLISLGELTASSGDNAPSFLAIFRVDDPSPTSPFSPALGGCGTFVSPSSNNELNLGSLMQSSINQLKESIKNIKESFAASYAKVLNGYDEFQDQQEEYERQNKRLLHESMQLHSKLASISIEAFFLDDISKDMTKLLKHEVAFKEFQAYCKTQHSEESLLFLYEVLNFQKKYKKLRQPPRFELESDALKIYEKFLKPCAELQINTGAQCLATVRDRIADSSTFNCNMFDDLFKDSLLTLNPCYTRFGQSVRGRAIIESGQVLF